MLGLGSKEAAWGRRTPALDLADEWGLVRGTNRGREATADPSQPAACGAGREGRGEQL